MASSDMIMSVLIVLIAVGAFLYMKSTACKIVLPAGAQLHTAPGEGYCGVSGYQPNGPANAGDATGTPTPDACAAVCNGRPGCTGYKWWNGSCFPFTATASQFNSGLAAADGWMSAIKLGTL